MMRILEFLAPFIIPIGISILGAIVDSVSQRGQQLAVHQGVLLPFRGLKRVGFYFSQYMHYIYLGFVAFDLAALIPARIGDVYGFGISFTGKPPEDWIPLVALAMLVHITVYIHTVLILREYEREKVIHAQNPDKIRTRPITYLHLVYFPVSLLFVILVRL